MPGYFHTLLCYGTIVYERPESLSIITLKHDLQLLPAFAAVISLIGLNVKDIQVIKCPGVEGFQSTDWFMELKWKLGASQQLFGWEAIIN